MLRVIILSALSAALILGAYDRSTATDWSRFRGPDGGGVSEAKNLPVDFGPNKGVAWKTTVPAGHSSPVSAGDRVFLTGWEQDQLITLCLDGKTGKALWRKQVRRERQGSLNANNSPATPTPVTDGDSVFVFFQDYGLIAYAARDGAELWRLPLGPFRAGHGLASSPVLARDAVVLVCDQDAGSFLLFVNQETGKILRRIEREGPSFSTPVVRDRGVDTCEVIVGGTGDLIAYDCRTGEKVWWVSGLPYMPKSSPLLARGSDGNDLVVFHARSVEDLEAKVPPFAILLQNFDKNRDGRVAREEVPQELRNAFIQIDLDGDGIFTQPEHTKLWEMSKKPHTLFALRPGRGDLSSQRLWTHNTNVPEVPTPLLYQNVLYILREGGIFISMNPETGEILKPGRLQGALATYYASPIAADGKIYLASLDGHLVALKAARDWQIIKVNEFAEPIFATPAIVSEAILIRTKTTLFCFGASQTK